MCRPKQYRGRWVLLSVRGLTWETVKKVNPDPNKDVMKVAVPDLRVINTRLFEMREKCVLCSAAGFWICWRALGALCRLSSWKWSIVLAELGRLLCSQLSRQLSGHWRFLFLQSIFLAASTVHGCVFPTCFISSLIKLPVIVSLEKEICVFINEVVTGCSAEHLVDAGCVEQLGSSQMDSCYPP